MNRSVLVSRAANTGDCPPVFQRVTGSLLNGANACSLSATFIMSLLYHIMGMIDLKWNNAFSYFKFFKV